MESRGIYLFANAYIFIVKLLLFAIGKIEKLESDFGRLDFSKTVPCSTYTNMSTLSSCKNMLL